MPAPKKLLREIEGWRRTLATEIEAQNRLSPQELHHAVNGIIDGLVFLRLYEKMGVGNGAPLLTLTKGTDTFSRYLNHVKCVEDRHGCELFVPDAPLRKCEAAIRRILRQLCRPSSASHLELTPAALGQIYERFLDDGPGADSAPNGIGVRRAGGVYYTPQPAIEAIVKHALGPALSGRSPRTARSLKILDPACGGGAFLLGALDFLFDWYLGWYRTHAPDAWARRRNPPLYKEGDEWRLTARERARIALAHIHGVDLDGGAVRVARRALTVKVLEGAAGDIVALDWSQNIKRGNALIGTDFYASPDERRTNLDAAARERVGAFDWQSEFAPIFSAGGFDVIIGNPPYANHSSRDSQSAKYRRSGQALELECFELCRDYCAEKYVHCSQGHLDSYKWFVARALELTKRGGHLGFIVPNTWITQSKYADLKGFICAQAGDLTVIDLGQGIFSVVVPTCLLIARKGKGDLKRYADLKDERDKWAALENARFEPLRRDGSRAGHALARKFIATWPDAYKMKSWVTLREGLHIKRERLSSTPGEAALPIIDSKNMGRYAFSWQPELFYANPPGPGAFKASSGDRLVVRKTGDSLVAALTPTARSFVLQSLYQSTRFATGVAPEYVLGLLNSKFLTFLYQRSTFGQKGRVMAQMRKGHLDQLPVPRLNLARAAHRARHDQLVELVKARLRGDTGCEEEINALVYELYELSEEEIAWVEGE
jgi:hypothetical protein